MPVIKLPVAYDENSTNAISIVDADGDEICQLYREQDLTDDDRGVAAMIVDAINTYMSRGEN